MLRSVLKKDLDNGCVLIKIVKKMKKIYVFIAILCMVPALAQTHELVNHKGEKIEVNYSKLEQNVLSFYYPGSLEENKISKYAVQTLIDKKTGATQTVSSKIDIKDNNDFRSVVFLEESETKGLTKGETIQVFFGRNKGFSNYDLIAMKKRRLQEKAAQKGSPFVVIVSESYDDTKAVLYHY